MALAHWPLVPHIMALLQMEENPEDVPVPHIIALPQRLEVPHMMAEPEFVLVPHMIALPPTNCELPHTAGPDQACDVPQTAEESLERVTVPVLEFYTAVGDIAL